MALRAIAVLAGACAVSSPLPSGTGASLESRIFIM